MGDPHGADVYEMYVRLTGKHLPREFWLYFNEWCKACKDNDEQRIQELQNHPKVIEYARWMEDVKEIVGKESAGLARNKKNV